MVSRAGYYKWAKAQKEDKDSDLKEIITFEYEKAKGIYGYRRMKIILKRKYGIFVNHKRVYRLMKQMNLQAVIRRKRTYTKSKKGSVILPNMLNRDFHAEEPNKKWVTDMSYIIFNGNRMYLSVILDLFNNEIVAYKINSTYSLEFVIDIVKEAMEGRDINGTILHSDQGRIYAENRYVDALKAMGITQSMSRKGNCFDNAAIESFFGHLKSELIYNSEISSKEEMTNEISNYMKFYNYERYQIKLGGMPPIEYKNSFERIA